MQQHKERYSITKMARIFGVSRSGYYAFAKRPMSLHEETDRVLSEQIRAIYDNHYGRYGSPRVWAEIKGLGWRVSQKRVERLMRELGLRARRPQQRVRTTITNHKLAVAENILNRDFLAAYPGAKWVSDITCLRCANGWLYLTIILDLWDRKVIGWSISEDLSAQSVCRALAMAVVNRRPQEGIIFHSDRGVQYCSKKFRRFLNHLCPTVRQSMSRKGNCWDNACAESFFGTLKVELEVLRRRCSKDHIKTAVFEYIEIYYNRRRRHSALGYATPIALTNNIAA